MANHGTAALLGQQVDAPRRALLRSLGALTLAGCGGGAEFGVGSSSPVPAPAPIPKLPPRELQVPTAAGQVVPVGMNTPQDVAPPGWSSYFTEYSLYNSYGAGVVVPEWSTGGAYVFANTGGHSHPDLSSALLFDYADVTWKRLDHTNGGEIWGTNNSHNFSQTQANGEPYWEITNTVSTADNVTYAVPLPGHPYQCMVAVPPSLGGGSRGGVMYVCRAAVGPASKISNSVHLFDLSTRRWRRVTNDLYPRPATPDGSVIHDETRGRYWIHMVGQHNYQSFVYLRASDWTFQTSEPFVGFMNPNVGTGNRLAMYNDKLLIQGNAQTLWMFDPDAPTSGVRPIVLAGAALPPNFRINRMVYYPPADSWYCARSDSGYPGNVLHRLSINTSSLTGIVTTVTLSQAIPQVGDFPTDQAEAYHMLHYVPSLQRLGWTHSATGYVYLIKPE